jgi:hypothetical protein
MNIKISAGNAFINGYWYENTDVMIKSIAVASSTLNRIDRIVLRLDLTSRVMSVIIKQGAGSGTTAVPPTLQRDTTIYELALADVSIPMGASSITDSQITDKRPDETVCGYVKGLVDQIATASLFSQFQSSFDTWFNTVKGQLSGDVAGNLQSEIDNRALLNHDHVVADITDFPSSMPANGGNSNTVNNHSVLKDVPSTAVFTDTVASTVTGTLTASAWTGTSAPYSQDVTVNGVTSTNGVLFDLGMSISDAQLTSALDGKLRATAQTTNKVTIKAFGDKPAIDIPVQFLVNV